MSPCAHFMPGWQQTGPPDDRHSDDRPGDLWEIWSSFYHHPRPGHWGNVPCYVWNDCSGGDIQPPGKNIPTYCIIMAVLKQPPPWKRP